MLLILKIIYLFLPSTFQEFSSILLELKKVEKQLQGKNRTSSLITSVLIMSYLDSTLVFCKKVFNQGFQWTVSLAGYLSNKSVFHDSRFRLSDQCDGRPRRDPGRASQPRPDQPLHPDTTPNHQNNFLLCHQPHLCSPRQRTTSRDPSRAWRTNSPGSGSPCWL